ncbi:F0F1 ATP synthase subunit delta [Patescibacteria group bacterium]|nr:F0F1 ATP synthase subunit delta [Patescibacteria group bacterium]
MNITPKQYASAWYELLSDKKIIRLSCGQASKVNKKMLAYLYKTGHLSKLAEILRNLEEIEQRQLGVEHALITSAHEISENQAKKLAKEILKTDEVSVRHKINPELIGGIQIETKNKRWDLSIKSQLLSLSKQLT